MLAPSGAPVAPSRDWPRKRRDASRVATWGRRLGRREKLRRLANFWQKLGGDPAPPGGREERKSRGRDHAVYVCRA